MTSYCCRATYVQYFKIDVGAPPIGSTSHYAHYLNFVETKLMWKIQLDRSNSNWVKDAANTHSYLYTTSIEYKLKFELKILIINHFVLWWKRYRPKYVFWSVNADALSSSHAPGPNPTTDLHSVLCAFRKYLYLSSSKRNASSSFFEYMYSERVIWFQFPDNRKANAFNISYTATCTIIYFPLSTKTTRNVFFFSFQSCTQ